MLESVVDTVSDEVVATNHGARADDVRAELERVLTSRAFVNSHRIRRFLQFVVEECLTGQRHRLKEYLIGLNVFDRREAFDPRVDSIVRVEARRLRSKLDGYYQSEGRDSQIRIVLHKGSYVPVFEDRSARASGASGSRPQRRAVAIARFTVPNGSGELGNLGQEINRRLTHVLIKEGNFQVVAPVQKAAAAGERELEGNAGMPKPDYIIEGSVEIHGARLHVIVQVLSTMDSSYVWSESADCDQQDLSCLEDLARSLTRELQSPRA